MPEGAAAEAEDDVELLLGLQLARVGEDEPGLEAGQLCLAAGRLDQVGVDVAADHLEAAAAELQQAPAGAAGHLIVLW